jgi:sec-independent protein translocase protein TatA
MFPGPTELIIILVIVIVIFGATRLPQIGEGLGKGIRNFRAGIKESREIDVTPEDDQENEMDSKS